MQMKVSFSCSQIYVHIGSNSNWTCASFTFLTIIALTAPHHSEFAVVAKNSCCLIYHLCPCRNACNYEECQSCEKCKNCKIHATNPRLVFTKATDIHFRSL